MKLHSLVLFIFLSSIITMLIGCQKNEIEDLQARIAELEEIVNAGDSVIFADITINNQAELDFFTTRKITHIFGRLELGNCHDLSPMKHLKYVSDLYISIPQELTSLDDLEYLENVSSLYLDFTTGEFTGSEVFPRLKSAESINISGWLPNTEWLNSLESVDHLSLQSWSTSLIIDGFGALTTLNTLNIDGYQTQELIINAFQDISSMYGLSINANDYEIAGFNNLTGLTYLSLQGNELVVSGFKKLSLIQYLELNANILNINSLDQFSTLESLHLAVFENGSGLANIRAVNSYLSLSVNKNTSFLSNLTHVGNLEIYSYGLSDGPRNLGELNLPSLKTINGLTVYSPFIESLEGFDFSEQTLEQLNIFETPELKNFTGLDSLSSPIEFVQIYNTSLVTLDGLDGVSGINYLYADNNIYLENWCAIKDIFDDIPENQRHINNNLVSPSSSADITGCD